MTTQSSDNEIRLLAYLAAGVRTSDDIQKRFGMSQATVSRLISRCGARILTIGKSRSMRYTCLRDVKGQGGEFPVFKIDSEGNAHQIGQLSAVAGENYFWLPATGPAELFKSLPWFISDLRPEGFVGRAFVRQQHQDLNLPPRVDDWHDDHVLSALARRGNDCMGNLIVGQESLDRYFRAARELTVPVRQEDIQRIYPMMANCAMDGQLPGSSAGGEQPKFTALVERDGISQNVLVKFSPLVGSEEGRRWADLLICEHHALQIIQEKGIAAARSCIVVGTDRVFLEVARFDRVGRLGRLPIISLRAIDNQFYGHQDSWVAAANRMVKDGRLSAEGATSLRWLSVFGNLIANTDQHFGNISLIMVDDRRRFDLAPAYDNLPMLYRPRDGSAPLPVFTPPASASSAPGEWDSALHWAGVFWGRTAEDVRISEEFRQVCAANRDIVMALGAGPRLVV